MALTPAQVDAAVPVGGTPSRALTNSALKTLIQDIADVGVGVGVGTVNTFADLPAPATVSGQRWWVRNSTGVWLVNRQPKGAYYSNGTAWSYLGDFPVAAAEVGNTPAGTIAATDVQGAINELDGDVTAIVTGFNANSRAQLEAALVAGANVSLAYSGSGATRQITVASAQGQPFDGATPFTPLSGAFITSSISAAALATQACIANQIMICPFVVAYDMTIDQIGVSVSTLVAASEQRMVIYESDPTTGRPTNLIAVSAATSGAAAATVFATLAPTVTLLRNKAYWIGVWSSSTQTLRTPGSTGVPFGWTNAATPVPSRSLVATVTYNSTASPGNWPTYANSQISTRTPALVLMRVA